MSQAAEPSPGSESEILMDYLPKLIRLAEKNMNAQLQQKVGAEDVGQTVLRTVLRRAAAGKLRIDQSEDFWKLLVTITLCKVRKKARHFNAIKRSSKLEQPMAIEPVDYRTLQNDPSADEAAEFADLLIKLEGRLDEQARAILNAKLQEKTHHEIASELGISTRTISRVLQDIGKEVQALFDED